MLSIRHIEHRHAVDRRALRRIRRRIHHVVCANDEHCVARLKAIVDCIHLIKLLIRHIRLAQ